MLGESSNHVSSLGASIYGDSNRVGGRVATASETTTPSADHRIN